MKTLMLLVALLALVAGPAGAEFVSVELQATGLTCSMCSLATEKSIRNVDFVADVVANLETTTYVITFKPNAKVSMDALAAAVEDAGFSVGSLVGHLKLNKSVDLVPDYHHTVGDAVYHFVGVEPTTLSGTAKVQFLDKMFAAPETHSAFAKQTTFECYQTGKVSQQCPSGYAADTRVYHVTM